MTNLENATIAIQKSGRLTQGSIEWLNEKARTDFPLSEAPFDKTRELTDSRTGITIAGFSNGDLLKAVVCGLVDVGIAGEDKVDELTYPAVGAALGVTTTMNQFANLEKKGIVGADRWKLALARKADAPQRPPSRIMTSYPNITRGWLKSRKDWQVDTVDRYGGGVEPIARRSGYDAVTDIVHSGETLEANGFVETDTIGWYSAVMVRITRQPLSPELFDVLTSTSILDILARRLESLKREPSESIASLLVTDGNEARQKVICESGEFIVEQALRRDVELEAADVLFALVSAMVESRNDVRMAQIELGSRYNGEKLLPLDPKPLGNATGSLPI